MSAKFAEAIREQAGSQAAKARNVVLGEVVSLAPLKVRLITSALVLDDDDFDLTAWVEAYDDEYGIENGDTVFLCREAGEWYIFDLLPEKGKTLHKAKSLDPVLTKLKADVAEAKAEAAEAKADAAAAPTASQFAALEARVTALENA